MDETAKRELNAYEKARMKGAPVFTLAATDITAHLAVEFWVLVQQTVKECMDDGATMVEAVETARGMYRVPRYAVMRPECLTEKERGACDIAKAMMGWGNRKLAD